MTSSSSSSSSQREIVLVAIEGEMDPGTEVGIPLDRPLAIGRSARGLQIPDPLVSIHHARISYHVRRGYVIEDLESATGTWVDEECIKGGSRPIGVGTVLRFGDTVFEVAHSNRVQPWMQAVAAVSAGMLLFALLVFLGMSLTTPKGETPCLATPKNRRVTCGAAVAKNVCVPHEFRRERGLSIGQFNIKDIRDNDKDGCDEVWLDVNGQTIAVTFGETLDDWKVLGEFPSICQLPNRMEDSDGHLPSVSCRGTSWFHNESTGVYELFEHEGVVVFYRPIKKTVIDHITGGPKAKAKGKKGKKAPPQVEDDAPVRYHQRIEVGRFTLTDKPSFNNFLVERGVSSPIHYLICETAFEKEVEPQVLMEHEAPQRLTRGCQNQLRIENSAGQSIGQPVAFALTETGRRALADNLSTFFGGDPEGLFLGEARARQIDQYRADPRGLVGSNKLVAETDVPSTGISEDFFVPTTALKNTPHQLVEHNEYQPGAAAKARTYTLTKKNQYLVPTPGCAELVTQVNDFTSEGWETMFPLTFLEVSDQKCSGSMERLIRANYPVAGISRHDAERTKTGGIDVRALIETTPTGKGIEVLRARIAVRDPDDKPPRLNDSPPPITKP